MMVTIATIITTSSLAILVATTLLMTISLSRLVLRIINYHIVYRCFRVCWSLCAHLFYLQLTREFSACPS